MVEPLPETAHVRAIYAEHGDTFGWNSDAGDLFDRWLATLNPWPALDQRYAAAARADLGDQLRPNEVTGRVMVALQNAFAAGALWQYDRSISSHSETGEDR